MEISAFGEQLVAELTPICGWTFAYNVNTDMVKTTVTGSGTVTVDAGRAKLSTGAAINSSAKVETLIPLRYITGMGALARFTAVFAAQKAGSQQYDLDSLDLSLGAGETLTISATSTIATDVSVAVNWVDLF